MLQSKGLQRVEYDLGIEQQQQLIYNFVLASSIQHSKSVTCVCVFFFRFFSLVDFYKILIVFPCVLQ